MKCKVKYKKFIKIGRKTTICLLTLDNGFEIVGTSACVNPDDFDERTGREWAEKDARNKLEMIDGFMQHLDD